MSKRDRGRPSTDLAQHVRIWGWYCLLREEAKKSDYALNREVIRAGDIDSSQLFEKIRRTGSVPRKVGHFLFEKEILKRIHVDNRYPEAEQWYRSKLWDFLTGKRKDKNYFTDFIDGECSKHGWFRATPKEAETGKAVFGRQEVSFQSGFTQTYRDMLMYLSGMPSLDGMVLLSALFREAYEECEIEIAYHVRNALDITTKNCLFTMPWPAALTECMELLIEDRIVGNHWCKLEDMPKKSAGADVKQQSARSNKTPKKPKVFEFIDWYISNDSRPRKNSAMSIVTDTDRTSGVRLHEPELRNNRLGLRTLFLRGDEIKMDFIPDYKAWQKLQIFKDQYWADEEDNESPFQKPSAALSKELQEARRKFASHGITEMPVGDPDFWGLLIEDKHNGTIAKRS